MFLELEVRYDETVNYLTDMAILQGLEIKVFMNFWKLRYEIRIDGFKDRDKLEDFCKAVKPILIRLERGEWYEQIL